MARTTVVVLEDDLDGGPADQSVTFGLDGVSYEIDLSNANAEKLRGAIHPYAVAARRIRVAGRPTVPAPSRRRASGPARTDREQLAAIRAWARARGLQVSDRGRIAAHIIEAYNNPAVAPAPTVTFTAPPQPAGSTRPRRR